MLKITSAATATWRGDSHHCSPRSISGSAFDLVRSFPYNSCPASSRRPDTRLPIAPTPTNPIALILFTSWLLVLGLGIGFAVASWHEAESSEPQSNGSRSAWSGGDVGERVRKRTRPADLALVERSDPRDVVRLELEVKELEVFLDPRRRRGLGEHDVSALDVPAKHHLRWGLVESLGDRGDLRVVEHGPLRDWRPCLRGDVVRLAIAAHLLIE